LPAAALLICLKPFWAFCPLNFSTPEVAAADSASTFRILSYNCLNLTENEPENAVEGYNRTLNTILHSGADVLVLAEFPDYALELYAPKIQADSMHALYPYHIYGRNHNALFSKTPIMYAGLPTRNYGSGSHEVYRTVIDGHGLMIFGVHMVSFGLNDEDKDLYRDFTEMERDKISLSGLRTHILDKLYDAFKLRSVQAMYIREYVDQLNGENVIVAGEFNDVPDCRPIRILEEAGLKSVYSEVGFGPMITFNNPTMPFRIDHVMYKGNNIRPVKMERGNLKSSDHYPLLTTFEWKD
ncbi:MAG: endonuclease/exonuclease/phosphatase family protein, partial [Muribaculaceae bacterium]|nr:endonuclease/exonuclease/phosphatase family protein [Muribaculaceae bacterium]